MNLSNQDVQLAQGMFVSSATQQHPLGTRGSDTFGRVYRYCRAGASDLVAGNVIQSAATIAGHLTLAVNTTSAGTNAGDQSFAVTCVSAVSTSFYREGYAIVATGAGQGYIYSIVNSPVVSTGATGVFTMFPEDSFQVAITTTSKISLIPNLYQNVIQAPASTATGAVIGVATYIITATQFGWIQTWGPCAVLSNDTSAISTPIVGIATTAGRIEGYVSATSGATATFLGNLTRSQPIGVMLAAGVAGEWRPVYLMVSP